MTRYGRGHGKLILFGEHSAVYGYPAVGTPLKVETEVRWTFHGASGLKQTADPSPREEWPGTERDGIMLPDDKGKDGEILHAVLKDLLNHTNPEPAKAGMPWTVRRQSSVPRSGGFGSSAALCTALAEAWLIGRHGSYDRKVHRLANQLESRFHGTPSGIDTGMACDSGVSAWIKKEAEIPERLPLNMPKLHLLYGALPRRSDTAGTVSGLKEKVDNGDDTVRTKMKRLGGIADEFISLTKRSTTDISESLFAEYTGDLAVRAQMVLSELGLSIPELETLLEMAKPYGALGGKLSGGGLGGAFWICAPDRKTLESLVAALNEDLPVRGIVLQAPLRTVTLGGGRPREIFK